MKHRAAITRIQVERIDGGKNVVVSRGTGALVHERYVLTALHVVANRSQRPPEFHSGTITLTFPGMTTKAKPVADAYDPDLDWVLLECESPPPVASIPLGELEGDADDIDWDTFGFPDANPEGMRIVGKVRLLAAEYQGQTAMQLFSDEAAAGEGAPVAGLSGAPCIVDNAIVGVVRSALLSKEKRNVAGTLFACPMAVILDRLATSHKSIGLPIADPCRGLPGLPHRDLPALPYRLLARYEERDAEVFFGRNDAIRNLYNKLTDGDFPPIMLFYGQSGTGKSSLLEAGLFPRLRPTHEIEYRRRSFERGLCGDLRDATDGDWLRREERLGKPLLVVIDQVEEAYTLSKGDPTVEIAELFDKVQQIFGAADSRPRGRLILSFRKEWLPEVKARVDERGLSTSMVFLERLDRKGIAEVVLGLTSTRRLKHRYAAEVENELGVVIADDLLDDHGSPIAPTLQIIMSKLWVAAEKASPEAPHFEQSAYQRLKRDGILLADFLSGEIQSLPDSMRPLVESGLVDDLLEAHTTTLGTSAAVERSDLEQRYAHVSREALVALVHELERRYLLTRPVTRELREMTETRLGHDTLAPLVRERFRRSDRPGQRARRLLEVRAGEWEAHTSGMPLDTEDLEQVENGLHGMRALTDAEKRLLDASRKSRRTGRVMLGAAICVLAGMGALLVIMWMDAVRSKTKAEKDTNQINREKAARHFEFANDETDLRQALMHLSRAVEVAPDDDPRLDLYIARALHVFTQLPTVTTRVTEEGVAFASVSADGNRVLVVDRSSEEARTYSVDSSDPKRGIKLGDPVRLLDENGAPFKRKAEEPLQLSGDGRWVLSSSSFARSSTKSSTIWETSTGKPVHHVEVPSGYKLSAAKWTPNSKHVVLQLDGDDRGRRWWMAASHDGRWSAEPWIDEPSEKRISDRGFTMLASGGPRVITMEFGEKNSMDRVRVLDARTRQPVDSGEPMLLHDHMTFDLMLDPKGTRLVVLSKGEKIEPADDMETARARFRTDRLNKSPKPGPVDDHVDVWDIATGKVVATVPTDTTSRMKSTDWPQILFVGEGAAVIVHDNPDRGDPTIIRPFSQDKQKQLFNLSCDQLAQPYFGGRAFGCNDRTSEAGFEHHVACVDPTLPIEQRLANVSMWSIQATAGDRFLTVEPSGWVDVHALVPRAMVRTLPQRPDERLLHAHFTADGTQVFTVSNQGRVGLFSTKNLSKTWTDELSAGSLPEKTRVFSSVTGDGRYLAVAIRETKPPASLLHVRVWDTHDKRMDKRSFTEASDGPPANDINLDEDITRNAHLAFVDNGPSIMVDVGMHEVKSWTPWSVQRAVDPPPVVDPDNLWNSFGFIGGGHWMLVGNSSGYGLVDVKTGKIEDIVPFRTGHGSGDDINLIRMLLDSQSVNVKRKSRSYATISANMPAPKSQIVVDTALGHGTVRSMVKDGKGGVHVETLRPADYRIDIRDVDHRELFAFDSVGFRFAYRSARFSTVHVQSLGTATPVNTGWVHPAMGELLAMSFIDDGERLVTIVDDGSIREWFVGHDYDTKPDWVKDLGALASGARFTDDETSIEPKPGMLYGAARDEAVGRIEKAARDGDPGAHYVLGHLSGKGIVTPP